MNISETIVKRDGRIVLFDSDRIKYALERCFGSFQREPDNTYISDLTRQVVNIVAVRYEHPTVENVQDIVETVLQAAGEYEAAKRYILYRVEHANMRNYRPIPDDVRIAFAESAQFFPTLLQQFQFYDKYSRYDYNLGRRETWIETVARAVNYLCELSENRLSNKKYTRIHQAILKMNVMPSMRLLAMAGPAARRNNLTIYNCSYMPVESIDAFVEALIISMNGCGVGFSVERQYVEEFPRIRRQQSYPPFKFIIPDSTEGWAQSLHLGLEKWFEGYDVEFDYSLIRPAGALLCTKGGRASGPAPLRKMLEFARSRILSRQGSFLRPIDAHDIMCAVGGAAVSGGMRRTAMLSLFDYSDQEMLCCKDGNFWTHNSQRWNTNNSAVWDGELSQTEVADFMLGMIKSHRGEPGIFSRQASINTRPSRRSAAAFGINPCGEIILRRWGLCNLSAAVARVGDSLEDLREKVKIATMIGTIQSLATHFPGLRPQWKQNCEEERLLGVSLIGQLDSRLAQDQDVQEELRNISIKTNQEFSKILGINPSASVTCVKPSGNSSVLLDCAAGIHARWSPYYIRNVRVATFSPVFKVLCDAGVPMDPENGQIRETATTWVIHFPIKSPDGAIVRKDRSAIEQCEYWLQNKTKWTDHNPSVTITYQSDEVLDLIKWVWANQDMIGGMAFLPNTDARYDQMPYEEISEEEYQRLIGEFPEVDFSKIYRYEEEDLTTAAQEIACSSGSCVFGDLDLSLMESE